MDGYMGKILRVNLSTGDISDEVLRKDVAKRYIGGYGVGARILYDELKPDVGALDPDNRLIFCTGPLTGTIVPCAARYCVVFKSPMTGYFGDANSGGFWGPELKFAGYDFIVFQGKSRKPVYLWVYDGEAEIKDASHLWGMDAREADRAIRKELGDKNIKVADIGPAGENLVRFASIMNDEAGRAAGRCGSGAVMGSKNLKAVAVRGHMKVPVVDEELLMVIRDEIARTVKTTELIRWFSKGGTPSGFDFLWMLGDVPAYNFSRGDFGGPGDPGVAKIAAAPGGYDEILTGTRSCYACPIGCRRVVTVREGPYAFEAGVEGPEYETQAAFGSNCGVDNIKAIAKANDLCNIYGMDTISCGCTIAFAMECYERGIITKKNTDGIELKFGNDTALVEMVEKIAKREGFGNVLAEGAKKAADLIGKGSERYAMHVKGLEIAMHDPRAFQGGGPHYAATITGGRHTEGLTLMIELGAPAPELGFPTVKDRFAIEGKGKLAKTIEDWIAVINSMGFCTSAESRVFPKKENVMRIYTAVTGWPMTVNKGLKVGERIFNLKKTFNIRHGATKADDRLPDRLLKEPKRAGGAKGVVVKLGELLPQYYKARGWDPRASKPSKQKLHELGLDDLVRDILE